MHRSLPEEPAGKVPEQEEPWWEPGEGWKNPGCIWHKHYLRQGGLYCSSCHIHGDTVAPGTRVPFVSPAAVLSTLRSLCTPRWEVLAGGGRARGKPAGGTVASSPVSPPGLPSHLISHDWVTSRPLCRHVGSKGILSWAHRHHD